MRYQEVSWWFWLASVICLATGLSYWPTGLLVLVGLTLIQVIYYSGIANKMTDFPVQVRAVYFLFTIAGFISPLGFVHWIQLFGTTAVVLFDYCPLARTLSLLPFNRNQPLSFQLLRQTLFALSTQHRIASDTLPNFVLPERRCTGEEVL
ncbi:MAG: hypothetical protein ACKVH8_04690 [Pirellulales bacterium]